MILVSSRPIISKTIKGAVLKNIAVGSVREYIKTHEAIKDFDELREEVLQMAMFQRTEHNAQVQKTIPMELNTVMDKLKGQMRQILQSVKERESKVNETKLNDDTSIADINAITKGKGKGKGVVCHNCGKNGHYAKHCWSRSYQSTGQCNWNEKYDIKENEQDFKGTGKGENESNEESTNERKQEQSGWENWQSAIEYETHAVTKSKRMQNDEIAKLDSCIDECIRREKEARQSTNEIMNVKGTWEKITFTGDSGAVDHVITPETGRNFEVKPTAASKAGLRFRAANGTPIKIFGERKLNGVTDGGDEFKMSCQVTDVKKNLASFVKMVNEGNDIVMSKKGSFIKNVSNGKIIKLDLTNGTPQFDVWVKKNEQITRKELSNVENENENDESAFRRLELLI